MTAARILIACERSGAIRRAMLARGHDCWSCDLAPADDVTNRHIVGDALDVIHWGWDGLIVAHPPCTILCNSGAKWLYIGGKKSNGRDEKRWDALDAAATFYRRLRDATFIPHRAVENPVMHGAAIELTRRGHTQFVHPYFFGDPFFKLTGFEIINLPQLLPTDRLAPPASGTALHRQWSKCHRTPPGPDRARLRSETYPGIASAIAEQWGDYIANAKKVAA